MSQSAQTPRACYVQRACCCRAAQATHMMIAGQRLHRQSQTRPAQERGQTKVGWHLWLCKTSEMPARKLPVI